MARPRSDIRPRLLGAARRRFLAEGVDGASLRTIAREAKTNVGMIFYYFPTKDDLFLAVVEEVYARLSDDLAAALGTGATTRERLGRALMRVQAASDDEVDVVRLVVREALLVPPSPRFVRLLERFRRGHVATLLGALARGVSDGEIDATAPLPLLLLATVGMGAFPQMVQRVAGREPPFSMLPPPPELTARALDLLFRGIAAPSPAPAPAPVDVAATPRGGSRRPRRR